MTELNIKGKIIRGREICFVSYQALLLLRYGLTWSGIDEPIVVFKGEVAEILARCTP